MKRENFDFFGVDAGFEESLTKVHGGNNDADWSDVDYEAIANARRRMHEESRRDEENYKTTKDYLEALFFHTWHGKRMPEEYFEKNKDGLK